MNWFVAKLEVRGSLKTPLVNDTLWGHVAWSILLTEGEQALQDFIESYESQPPLVFSHAFPEGFLPMPKLQGTIASTGDIKYKELAKIKFLPCSIFGKQLNWAYIQQEYKNGNIPKVSLRTVSRIRNSINRLTATVEEGLLWSEHSSLWQKEDENISILDLYILSVWDSTKLKSVLERTFAYGYGGKSGVGYGNIHLLSIESYVPPKNGNRMMTLGCVAALPSHLPDLLSDIVVRQGKLGPIMAQSLLNPYKKPIVMFEAGSTCTRMPQQWAGTIVHNVHTDTRIVSCGIAPLFSFTEALEDS